jgi:predicted Zn-dependent protease
MNDTSNTRLEELKKYLLDDPKDTFLRYAMAMELFRLNFAKEALKEFKSLTEEEPDYLATYYQYGKLLEETGDLKSAIEIYTLGLKVAENQNNTRTFKELKQARESLIDYEDEPE